MDQCFRHCFWSFIRASCHSVLRFCFLVALRFECTLASLFFLYNFSSCQGVSLFLVVFLGARKKVDQCCWCVEFHGVLCFCCSFLAGGCALVFCLFHCPAMVFPFF